VAPASTRGPYGRACDFSFGGPEFYVSKLNAPGLKTLDYGQTYSRGAITCDSEFSGVICTDTPTGHFLRVSRENYEFG
jgi:hypothetical protein